MELNIEALVGEPIAKAALDVAREASFKAYVACGPSDPERRFTTTVCLLTQALTIILIEAGADDARCAEAAGLIARHICEAAPEFRALAA